LGTNDPLPDDPTIEIVVALAGVLGAGEVGVDVDVDP
jgi:hypothetical protein